LIAVSEMNAPVFASHFAARDPGLDLLENPVEGVHLLGEGDVGHSFLLV